jgi:hypothetical protein
MEQVKAIAERGSRATVSANTAQAPTVDIDRAYPTLPVEYIRREAGRAFVDGIEDPDIKIKLLLGGEQTVNEALRQALELQAVLLVARQHKSSSMTF